ALAEPQVRQIMEYYLAVRLRRFGRAYAPNVADTGTGTAGETMSASGAYGSRPSGYAAGTQTVTRPAPPRYGAQRPMAARPPARTPGRP
ncbi:MAG TPA: hypothetical protein VIH37_08730, partial [Candidatus Limnocylindrales bacterium]